MKKAGQGETNDTRSVESIERQLAGKKPQSVGELIEFAEAAQGDASQSDALLRMLDERNPIYRGVDSLTVARMRSALLAALSWHSLSSVALPFVLEELESAYDPTLTAVAAAALRRYPETELSFTEILLKALQAIHAHDGPVKLRGESTSATLELLRTLRRLVESGHYTLAEFRALSARMLEPAAHDVLTHDLVEGAAVAPSVESRCVDGVTRLAVSIPAEIASLELQDQASQRSTFDEVFRGHITLVTFFFTRCGNPLKCPLTVARLGRLQQRIEREQLDVRTAAFTYDPAYDTPVRLLHYARSWGALPSSRHQFLRVVRSFDVLRDFFELGVGYGPGGVNRHQLEVFVIDRGMVLARALRRRLWTEDQVLMLANELG